MNDHYITSLDPALLTSSDRKTALQRKQELLEKMESNLHIITIYVDRDMTLRDHAVCVRDGQTDVIVVSW